MNARDPSAQDRMAMAEAAAEWIVRLDEGGPDERAAARRGFEDWKQADPRHTELAAGLERWLSSMRGLSSASSGRSAQPARAARAALDDLAKDRTAVRPRRSRRVAGLATLVLAVLASVVWTARSDVSTAWLADLRTSTGEQRVETLADGSRVTLSSGTAANVAMQGDRRQVKLLQGEILVDVAKDAARPFEVDTPHGRIRALGTKFVVRRDPDATRLTMIESRTRVQSAAGGADLTLTAGQQLRLTPLGAEPLPDVDPGTVETAFQARRLVVRDVPLAQVLDELARHRRGVIRYDRAAIDGMRVSAVLPLDDTDRALDLLLDNFSRLRIRTVTPWVVLVDAGA